MMSDPKTDLALLARHYSSARRKAGAEEKASVLEYPKQMYKANACCKLVESGIFDVSQVPSHVISPISTLPLPNFKSHP